VLKRLLKIRILSFMMVGSIGLVVNTTTYYLLTCYLQTLIVQFNIAFLGQLFYLPAFIPAAVGGISLNYFLNRRFTFGDCNTQRTSYLKYLCMCLLTSLLDMSVLFVLVQFIHIYYMFAFVMAVLCVFSIRYYISKQWIWHHVGVVR
jgi:putative flippase GtrA